MTLPIVNRLQRAWWAFRSTRGETDDFWYEVASKNTAAGVPITEANSIQLITVFACVKLLAETIASLPLHVYRRRPDGGKDIVTEHKVNHLLHTAPNPTTTALELREAMVANVLLRGNAYAQIVFDKKDNVESLWLLMPEKMRVSGTMSKPVYLYRVDGREQVVPTKQVLHLRDLTLNGVTGISRIQQCRESLGLTKATEEFGARFFSNGARPSGVFTHPGKFKDDPQRKQFRNALEEQTVGLGKAHSFLVLEQGITWNPFTIPPDDAQFLETRKFQRGEICALFRVPPPLIQDLERATFSNIEHQAIHFGVYTVRPMVARYEQRYDLALLSEAERQQHYSKHKIDGLLRGDTATRNTAYATARQWGWLSANDIRALEDMNPIDDGDIYLTPLNMVPAGTEQPELPAQEPPDKEEKSFEPIPARALPAPDTYEVRAAKADERRRLAEVARGVFTDAMERVVRREVRAVRAEAKKHLQQRGSGQFNDWISDYYGPDGKLQANVRQQMTPVMDPYAQAVRGAAAKEVDFKEVPPTDEFLDQYIETFAGQYAYASAGQLRAIIGENVPEDWHDEIDQRLREWEQRRANKVGRRQSIQLGAAIAKWTFIAAGITRLMWVSSGSESCPYCNEMDGRIVGIEQHFIGSGQALSPEGAERPMKINGNKGHPPLHDGCQCFVVSA